MNRQEADVAMNTQSEVCDCNAATQVVFFFVFVFFSVIFL